MRVPVERLIEIAKRSKHRCRHGAVVVKGKELVSDGVNKNKTHPKSYHPYQSTHAEFNAVQRASGDISGATLYVVRLLVDDSLAMSKPCPYCTRTMEEVGINKVVYSDEHGEFQELRLAG